ncbi:MAG TPA: DUF2917 domain-containing protein [Ramlibacter sp.]|nr:DUF2917 domain-containing protein [Ramlibacter sp.]
MASQTLTQMQQSAATPALPGTWKLPVGRAITFQPREPGVLRVAHGQLWATFDGPHAGPLNDLGDHVVGAGGQLRVCAGQRLVVEAWNTKAATYFSWEPLPLAGHTAAPRVVAVVQPLADLRLAFKFGAGAAGRLIKGVIALAWDVLAVRRTRRYPELNCA